MKTIAKRRSDIALTLELTNAIFQRLQTGLPLIRRENKYLLLDGQKWAGKVPVGTYNSWRTRNTIPIDSEDDKGFNELLAEIKDKIAKEKREELLRLGEQGMSKILSMPVIQKTIEKRINKNGEIVSVTTTKAVNPTTVNAQVKVAMFTLERLDSKNYGKLVKTDRTVPIFSLAELRRYKEEHKK